MREIVFTRNNRMPCPVCGVNTALHSVLVIVHKFDLYYVCDRRATRNCVRIHRTIELNAATLSRDIRV